MQSKKKLVVVGGGFAGLHLVRSIDKKKFDVFLIDKLNHHQFQPLFYQVATSQLEPSSISFPFRNVFRNEKSVHVRLGELEEVMPDQNLIKTSIGDFPYDYLVLALGCRTNFFGKQEIEEKAFSLKTTYDAIAIRNHILLTFEKCSYASEAEKEKLLNLVIVGAGPTGVELAGAFAEIKKFILPRDYPGIDFSKFTVYLIEGGSAPLGSMSENAQKASADYLKRMGINLITGAYVEDYNGEILKLNNGETIKTATVIWSAGVTGNRVSGFPDPVYAPGNRIRVDRFSRVLGFENIFAVGDIAFMETPEYPRAHPQVANVAINQAKRLAKNFNKGLSPEVWTEFEYKDLGSMATIGKNKAVVDFPRWKFKGYFAWLIWMFLHLMLILSVKNKLIIFINWAWAYMTKDSSLRLILKPGGKKNGK